MRLKHRPSIFKRAARLVEKSIDRYGYHRACCYALTNVGANSDELAIFGEHYFNGDGLWFGSIGEDKNAKHRIRALLQMVKIVKKMNEENKKMKLIYTASVSVLYIITAAWVFKTFIECWRS